MGDRRLVTILFADLASFTATSENTDPEDVIDILNQVFTRLAVEYDREGGYLDKTVGDQLMVLFGAPRAHEDDPVRAVRAALGMQAAMKEMAPTMREKIGHAFKLNIGINTGIVVWGRMGPAGRTAATVIGDDVNLASRLEHYATNGQIIVSDVVYSLTRRYFDYEILEPIRVKGKSNPVPIYTPLRPKRSFRASQSSKERSAPLVERDQELQALHNNLSFAVTGKSRFVVLTGEAGMGKSRLLDEFATQLQTYKFKKTPTILQAYGGGGTSEPYSPVAEILSQLFDIKSDDSRLVQQRKIEDRGRILGMTQRDFVPLMGYLLGWYQDDQRLSNLEQNVEQLQKSAATTAVSAIFKQATRRPTLVLIDNLQWADSNSLMWLQLLGAEKTNAARQQHAHDLLVVTATRPQLEIPLTALNPDEVISLPPLSNHARRDLISSLLPGGELPTSLVDRLVNESGGNPFYLEEAARGLIQSEQLVRDKGKWRLTRPIEDIYIPHSVEGQVMAHLDVLDETSRIVLQHASVIGMTFSYRLLAAITPVKNLQAAIEDLEQRALIKNVTPTDETTDDLVYSFSQMVVREVAYRTMLRKTRRELHDKIAALTETNKPAAEYDTESVESLARHYMAGDQEEKKVIYNWLVGQRALETYNFEDACQHLEVALNALKEIENPDPDTWLQVANGLGDASTFTGNFDRAASCYKMVWEMVKNNPEELIKLYYRTGRLNFYQGNIEAAATSYQYAQNLAQNNPDLLPQINAEIRLMYDLD